MRKLPVSFALAALIGLSVSGCDFFDLPVIPRSDDIPEADISLVFGTYYGFCFGDCADIYKLEEGQLFADKEIENFYEFRDEELPFEADPRPEEDYSIAETLLETFPTRLFDEEEETLGIPDAHDQGGIYLEIRTPDRTQRWFLDTIAERLPEYLRDYAREVMEIVRELER